MFTVQEPSRCELWEFRICAANDEGLGPFSAIEQSYFAPHIPKGKPENVTVANITAQSVNIAWAPVADLKDEGSDGYRVSSCKFLKFCSYVGIDKIGERAGTSKNALCLFSHYVLDCIYNQALLLSVPSPYIYTVSRITLSARVRHEL